MNLLLIAALLLDCKALENKAPADAITCLQTAIANAPDARTRSDALTELAWLHWKLAQFERALADFRQVLALSREMHDRTLEARTINFTGLLYQTIGEMPAAREHYQQALPIARELGDQKLLGEVLYHLGWLSFQSDDFHAALQHYGESLEARRRTGDRFGEAMTLLGLGMTHTSLGEYDEAIRNENEGLAIGREIGNRDVEADALDHIGTALRFQHRGAEAIEHHRRALAIRRAMGQGWSTTFSLTGIARAQHDLGNRKEAAATMTELIDVIEGGRRNFMTRRFRGSVFARMHGHYDRAVVYLMDAGDVSGALAMSERARARLTLDAVQEALVRADTAAGGTLMQREAALQTSIEGAGGNLEDLLAQLARVEDEIHRQHPRLAAAREESPLGTARIQSEVLDGETALVEFSLGEEKSYAWVVTRDDLKAVELPKRSEIEPIAVQLNALLSAGDQRIHQHDIETALGRLSAAILQPLAIPRDVSRLLIVPDGALFYVPFAALSDRRGVLIDRFEIAMAPSASVVALMRKVAAGRSHDASVAIFADPVFAANDPRVTGAQSTDAAPDPELVRSAQEAGLQQLRRLPSTRAEAETISRLATGRTRKALDFAASRNTVITENLGRYRVVHFATHALINAQHPQRSGIILSLVDPQGKPVNGFLRVDDLFGLHLDTDLVVLSACRTAMGKELRGEGIVGLVSGFMYGGAERVIASYWDVKDEATAELMTRFYSAMFQRKLSPAAALRTAQQSMRAEPRWRAPYYWAAFALYGVR